MLSKQKLRERKDYIGASECAAVLGLSRWSSPLMVWFDKTSDDVKEKEKNIAMQMGDKLEQAIAELFEAETGKKVQMANLTKYHKDYKFIAANLDRKVIGENACLECKSVELTRSGEFKDENLPPEMIYQVMHQLAVSGYDYGYIAILIGKGNFKWQKIDRDEDMIKTIIEKEVHFWKTWVEPKVMPDIITSIDGDILQEIYGITPKNESIVVVDNSNDEYFRELKETKEKIKELEKHEKELENKFKFLIGENTGIKTEKYSLKWSEVPETLIEAYTRKGYRKLGKITEAKNADFKKEI